MKIILARRGEGKTRACVEYLRSHPKVLMVCASQRHVEYARRAFTRNESHVTSRIQTWEWLLGEPHRARNFEGMVIDDIEALLAHILELKIEAVSMTWPDAAQPSRQPGNPFNSRGWP